jgi:hypothetical protein
MYLLAMIRVVTLLRITFRLWLSACDEEFRKKGCALGVRPTHILFSGYFMPGRWVVIKSSTQNQSAMSGNTRNHKPIRKISRVRNITKMGEGRSHPTSVPPPLLWLWLYDGDPRLSLERNRPWIIYAGMLSWCFCWLVRWGVV